MQIVIDLNTVISVVETLGIGFGLLVMGFIVGKRKYILKLNRTMDGFVNDVMQSGIIKEQDFVNWINTKYAGKIKVTKRMVR